MPFKNGTYGEVWLVDPEVCWPTTTTELNQRSAELEKTPDAPRRSNHEVRGAIRDTGQGKARKATYLKLQIHKEGPLTIN